MQSWHAVSQKVKVTNPAPPFPFPPHTLEAVFSLATLISSQAPPCWDGGTFLGERERERAFSTWKSPCSSPWLTGCASLGLRPGVSMKGDGNIPWQSTAPFRALLNLLVWHFLGESSRASLSCDLLKSMNYVKTQNPANTWKALVGAFLTKYFLGSGSH